MHQPKVREAIIFAIPMTHSSHSFPLSLMKAFALQCVLKNSCFLLKQEKHFTALWMGFSKSQQKELSLLHVTHLLVLLFIPTKSESNPLRKKSNIQLWKKVNQKVNLWWHTPARLDITILKDRFFLKNPVQKHTSRLFNKEIHQNGFITPLLRSVHIVGRTCGPTPLPDEMMQ